MAKLHLKRNARDTVGAGGRDYPAGYYEVVDTPSDVKHMDRDFAARAVAKGLAEEVEDDAEASEAQAPASEAPEPSAEEKERAEAAARIASGGSGRSRRQAPAEEKSE